MTEVMVFLRVFQPCESAQTRAQLQIALWNQLGLRSPDPDRYRLRPRLGGQMRLLKALLVLGGWSMPAASQTTIPDTAPGKLLKGWIDTFNAGDGDARAKFIRRHYSDAVLDGA